MSQSIIHVEKDDVDIDSDEEDEEAGAGGADDDDNDENGGGHGGAGSPRARTASATPAPAGDSVAAAATPAPPKKPKVTISYDKYMLLMQRIVYMIAEHEKDEGAGMPRSEVVQTYLDGIEDQLGTIEQLEAETQLVEKVLNKLIKEKYLLELRGSTKPAQAEGEAPIPVDGEEQPEDDDEEPVLTVHPECDVLET